MNDVTHAAAWPKQLAALLKTNAPTRPTLDAVIDSGGGDIMGKVGPILKHAGRVVCYGMTAEPKITMTMREVMRNQQLLGASVHIFLPLFEYTSLNICYSSVQAR
jgi:NADPH:quinone reductase-like Zn-dependent oxidoreductase